MNQDNLPSSQSQRLAVSPDEAARLVGLGRTTIYSALRSGALRSAKIGARRLITIPALQEWISSFETKFEEANHGA